MPSQILYEFMNYGSLALVVAAIAVGVVLTKTAVRKLLAAALVVTVLRFVPSTIFPGWLDIANEATAFAYSLVQTLLSVGEVVLLVGAAVVGARTIRAKDAALAALTDEPTDTWRQPESSPDPRLLAD
jgi:hypothetical protein